MLTTCKCTSGESMSQSANKSDDDISEHRIRFWVLLTPLPEFGSLGAYYGLVMGHCVVLEDTDMGQGHN